MSPGGERSVELRKWEVPKAGGGKARGWDSRRKNRDALSWEGCGDGHAEVENQFGKKNPKRKGKKGLMWHECFLAYFFAGLDRVR